MSCSGSLLLLYNEDEDEHDCQISGRLSCSCCSTTKGEARAPVECRRISHIKVSVERGMQISDCGLLTVSLARMGSQQKKVSFPDLKI
eukprot:scaffold162707_cov45-Attheya_sp.AAC.1